MKFIYILLVVVFISCAQYEKEIKRKYIVRVSNWVGGNSYECDSVIWVNDRYFKLKNKEDRDPFLDIIISDEYIVRIYLKK